MSVCAHLILGRKTPSYSLAHLIVLITVYVSENVFFLCLLSPQSLLCAYVHILACMLLLLLLFFNLFMHTINDPSFIHSLMTFR